LIAEGFPADRIIKTGSPMFEVLTHYRSDIDASRILEKLSLEPREYFLVSCHREENVDSAEQLTKFCGSLNAIAAHYSLPILVSTHPRTRNRIEALGLTFDPLVQLLKPFGFLDYNALQLHARAVLSDSGTISEESSILNFPALNIRDAHERPEAMEEASVMLTGLGQKRILQALAVLAQQQPPDTRNFQSVLDYTAPNVSEKVVRIIHSYTDYVKKVVWRDFRD
jgi:UDP-N-acetyl-L-fucosamine synthase